jgi:hypothetical protein
MRLTTPRAPFGRRALALACLAASLSILRTGTLPLAAQTARGGDAPVATLTHEERQRFLETAEITRARDTAKGITGSLRVTLSDGAVTHDAHVQTIDEYKAVHQSNRGTELNFYDTWRYNLAAYHLNQMLGLDMVPVTVERAYRGKPGSFTWWVDDVLMDESERLKQKARAPDERRWSEQMWTLRIFDQLIENVDRNLGNMLIDTSWKVWMIDHSRAFRRHQELRSPKNLTRVDRELLAALKALTFESVKARTGRWLRDDEIRPLLVRRDLIVGYFEKLGPSAVYETPPRLSLNSFVPL